MNLMSLVVTRWLRSHELPNTRVRLASGIYEFADAPTVDAITAFCHSEFDQVPSRALAVHVRKAILALATSTESK